MSDFRSFQYWRNVIHVSAGYMDKAITAQWRDDLAHRVKRLEPRAAIDAIQIAFTELEPPPS